MNCNILCALRGNNSVEKLTIAAQQMHFGEKEMRSLLQVLPGNSAVEHQTIKDIKMSDEKCILLFQSVATHPRINVLPSPVPLGSLGSYQPLSAASKTTRMNAILQMLRRNTVVQTTELPSAFNNEEVYQNLILPRLEMNRSCFEVQRQVVKRAHPSIRPQLLGRALHVVQYNSDLFFRFLSENIPAFVRAENEEDGDR
jgi:hypothetical protein